MVLGEGGALLVMETEAHATARGARVLARMLSATTSSDGYDALYSDPDAAQETHALTRTLELAGLEPGDVDLVNAHAAGTVAGDLVEATALRQLFGSHRPRSMPRRRPWATPLARRVPSRRYRRCSRCATGSCRRR